MKFATYRNGTRDGQLMVVSRDLRRAIAVPAIATTLQEVLDNWKALAPQLEEVYQALNKGALEGAEAVNENRCESRLPRAYQRADGSAYVNHVELVRKARNAEMPASCWADPLMYQGGSDDFLGPKDHVAMADPAWGIDFAGEGAVITDEVAMAVSAAAAGQYIRLLLLVNNLSLRGLLP